MMLVGFGSIGCAIIEITFLDVCVEKFQRRGSRVCLIGKIT